MNFNLMLPGSVDETPLIKAMPVRTQDLPGCLLSPGTDVNRIRINRCSTLSLKFPVQAGAA
jgi:hypothetical protein